MVFTNTLKALAIIAVVAIHVLAVQHSTNYSLNLFLRFSVPLFVALSGFGLAKSFSQKRQLFDFYFRRALRLLPWYFFWGTVIYLYINYAGQGPATYGSTPIWTLFVLGRIDYHLYFVPMIFVLYLLFPLLWTLVRKFPRPILLAAFLWQVYFYWQLNTTSLSDQQQYVQAGSWLFYFVLGIFLAFRPKLPYYPAILLTVLGLFWSFSQIRTGVDPIIFTRFTQTPVLFYATGFILTSLIVAPRLPLSFLIPLGELSYLVYLNHTLILRLLIRLPFDLVSAPFPLLLIIEVVISALISWVVQFGVRRVSFLFSRPT